MARQGKPIEVVDYDFSKGWGGYGAWHDAQLAALTTNTDSKAADLTGSLVRFPRADGHAYYVVTKHKPLTLSCVLLGDAWEAAPETIRGTREEDVRDQLRRQEILASFARQQPEQTA